MLGPKLGGDVQLIIKAAKAGKWEANDDGTVSVAGHTLAAGEFELGLEPLDGVIAAPLTGNDAVVVLDVNVTPELEAEGLARDLVRLVQQLRKDRELSVTDRVRLRLELSDELQESLEPHLEWVAGQVLASEIAFSAGLTNTHELGDSIVGFDLDLEIAR